MAAKRVQHPVPVGCMDSKGLLSHMGLAPGPLALNIRGLVSVLCVIWLPWYAKLVAAVWFRRCKPLPLGTTYVQPSMLLILEHTGIYYCFLEHYNCTTTTMTLFSRSL